MQTKCAGNVFCVFLFCPTKLTEVGMSKAVGLSCLPFCRPPRTLPPHHHTLPEQPLSLFRDPGYSGTGGGRRKSGKYGHMCFFLATFGLDSYFLTFKHLVYSTVLEY